MSDGQFEPLGRCELMTLACEGAFDRWCGRPRRLSPYRRLSAEWQAWAFGYDLTDELIEAYAAIETRRWLEAA